MSDRGSQFEFGSFKFLARARAIRIFLWVLLATFPVYIAYSLAPYLDTDATTSRIRASKVLEGVREEMIKSVDKGERRETYYSMPVSEFVEALVPVRAEYFGERPTFEAGRAQLTIRYDRLILWIGVGSVFVLTFGTLLPSLTRLQLGPLKLDLDEASRMRDAELDLHRSEDRPATPVALFELEVKSAERRADVLFVRSTLLLGGGIIMAFIGVAIFYVTLPESAKDDSIESYWLRTIRPTGVLIFVEAIAWFLLRQYRALIEDYKWFHRLYMKRANYLAAIRILEKTPVRPEDMFLAASLVHEDLSGKLRKDETTEALEKLKISEDSPVTEILRVMGSLAKRERKGSATKPKKAAEQVDT
jgi:hypothetical protein